MRRWLSPSARVTSIGTSKSSTSLWIRLSPMGVTAAPSSAPSFILCTTCRSSPAVAPAWNLRVSWPLDCCSICRAKLWNSCIHDEPSGASVAMRKVVWAPAALVKARSNTPAPSRNMLLLFAVNAERTQAPV